MNSGNIDCGGPSVSDECHDNTIDGKSNFHDTCSVDSENGSVELVQDDAEANETETRRVISREELYNDPDAVAENFDLPKQPTPDNDWTRDNWRRAGLLPETSTVPKKKIYTPVPVVNRLHKSLFKAMSQPVTMSKAESMMQKMGYQGGGLGKSGEGILEPIAPNATYANKNIGFGQNSKMPVRITKPPANKAKTKSARKNILRKSKEQLRTNALNVILEFVKNNKEIEILFDKKLFPKERRIIHCLVHEVINADDDTQRVKAGTQQMILNEIYAHNCFVLGTESEGEQPHRQLRIYKEAPPDVFLVTPEDLPELKVDTQRTEPSNPNSTQPNNSSTTADMQTDVKNILDELMNCFVEFTKDNDYTQLKFLGPFCEIQEFCIYQFFNVIHRCVNKDFYGVSDSVVSAFNVNTVSFELVEDVNGSTFVQKRKQPMK